MERNLIGLYKDVGATLKLWECALEPLQDEGLYAHHIGCKDILEHDTLNPGNTRYAAIVFPGTDRGSIAYREQLQGIGYDRVRAFVHNGATAVGVCAGMGPLGGIVDWRDPQLMRRTHNNMWMVRGMTCGPIDLYHPQAPVRDGWFKANTTAVAIDGEERDARLLWWGGGYFVPDEEVNVLARFRDVKTRDGQDAIAAVHKKFGAGDVVLSSIHFEVSGRTLAENVGDSETDKDVDAPPGTYRRSLVRDLDASEPPRQRLLFRAFQSVLEKRRELGARRFG